MNTQIKATNMELTTAIDSYVSKKVSSFEKLLDISAGAANLSVEIGKTTTHHKTGDYFFAELNLSVDGQNFRAVSQKDDLYKAIDSARDEMADILRTDKDKHNTLLRRGKQKIKGMIKGYFNR